jgi:hypothetical protein
MLRFVGAGLCVLLATGLVAGGSALEAEAQPRRSAETTAPALDPVTLIDTTTVEKLTQMLTSPHPEKRSRAFGQVISLGHHAPEVDLTPVVPVLIDIYLDDPSEKYRLAAVVALYFIGDERGMQQVLQRFVQEPSLIVQYISVCALIDHYGPQAFGRDEGTVTLARNVLARKHEAERLIRRQRLIEQQRLRMWPRVTTGTLEIIEADSLRARADSLQ